MSGIIVEASLRRLIIKHTFLLIPMSWLVVFLSSCLHKIMGPSSLSLILVERPCVSRFIGIVLKRRIKRIIHHRNYSCFLRWSLLKHSGRIVVIWLVIALTPLLKISWRSMHLIIDV